MYPLVLAPPQTSYLESRRYFGRIQEAGVAVLPGAEAVAIDLSVRTAGHDKLAAAAASTGPVNALDPADVDALDLSTRFFGLRIKPENLSWLTEKAVHDLDELTALLSTSDPMAAIAAKPLRVSAAASSLQTVLAGNRELALSSHASIENLERASLRFLDALAKLSGRSMDVQANTNPFVRSGLDALAYELPYIVTKAQLIVGGAVPPGDVTVSEPMSSVYRLSVSGFAP
jgi:hypothetical protein